MDTGTYLKLEILISHKGQFDLSWTISYSILMFLETEFDIINSTNKQTKKDKTKSAPIFSSLL